MSRSDISVSQFQDVSLLSPVREEDGPLESPCHRRPRPRPPLLPPVRPCSPLPPLIIEVEKRVNKHDDPEEFYVRLEKKMKRIYRRLFTEDLSEMDQRMANRNIRKSTDSEGDTPTDSSNSSVPYDTPEYMRRQISRHSDVSIQKLDNESIASSKASDLGHSLSSVRKSTNSQQSSRNDGQNGQIAKRRKMTDKTNSNTEYPSSPDLTTDGNSEDTISDEAPNLADDNQNILQITISDSVAQAASKTDQNETAKSSEEENSREHPCSPTFTDIFDFVAGLPNHPDTEIAVRDEERAKSTVDKNSEGTINEVATRNKSDENVNITKISSAVRCSDDVVKDSDNGRVDFYPMLPSTAGKMRNSRRGTKHTSIMEIVAKDGDTANLRPVLLTLEGDSEGYFRLLPEKPTGRAVLVASDVPIDRESDAVLQNGGVYNFFIKATELINNEVPSDFTVTPITIIVTDVDDHVPKFNKEVFDISIPENIENGSPVPGLSIYVEDNDIGQNSKYDLSLRNIYNSEGIFALSTEHGEGRTPISIRVRDSTKLDYDVDDDDKRRFSFDIVTSSGNRELSSARVNIKLLDMNDNFPVFDETSYKFNVVKQTNPHADKIRRGAVHSVRRSGPAALASKVALEML